MILKAGKRRFLLRELPSWWPEVLADESTQKIMHNAKFDLMWMIDFCPDQEQGQAQAHNIRDTMLMSQLAGRYRTKSGAAKAGFPDAWEPNDLASVLRRYLDVSIDKSVNHDETDWTGPWSHQMLEYMLEDIDYLEPLHDALQRELQHQGQERASDIENEVVFGTAWMTLNGMLPDVAAWKQSIEQWRDEHREILEDLERMWPGVANFGSPKQLMASSEAVFDFELKTTKKAVLKQLAPDYPPIARLLDQRRLGTRLKNWGPTFLRLYVCQYPECGRLHPSWNQIGTETSRFSCSRPNAQQFPRAPEFRRMIVASPGCRIAALDYSAIEVVSAAVFANDRNLLEACRTGDPHLATAKMIAKDDTITKQDPRRQNAKIANFGLLFGGGAQSLVNQARDLFDVILTLEQAQEISSQYFRLYTGLRQKRNEAYDAMNSPDAALEVSNNVGFRRILEGRNRKPTSWLNSQIQSLAGYGLKSSFRYLNDEGLLPCLIGQIHDELLFEFPEEWAEEGMERAKRCMLRGMKEVLGRNAPVHVDADLGACWL